MSDDLKEEEKQSLVLKKFKQGSTLDIEWQEWNESVEQYEKIGKKFKEMIHPDLREALNVMASNIMEYSGFPTANEYWGAPRIKSIEFTVLNQLKAVIVFSHSAMDMVEVKIPEIDLVPIQVVDELKEEILNFVQAKKKAQGDLFNFDIPDAEYEIMEDQEALPEKQKSLEGEVAES